MLDFLNSRYIHSGQRLREGVPNENDILEEINAAIQGANAIDGYPFPSNLAPDQQFKWASTMHQAVRYIDVLTRSPGLTERVTEEGIQAIPKEHWPLLPATFGLNENFPPTVLLHGDLDDLVDFGLSSSVASKLQNLRISVHSERVVGQGHGFEAHEYIDLDVRTVWKTGMGSEKVLNELLRYLNVILRRAEVLSY